jgi:glucose/arabinose dehydrogenase
MKWRTFILIALMPGVCCPAAEEKSESKQIVSKTFRPQQKKFSEELLHELKVPAGFTVNVFARDLQNPRMMLLLPDGSVLVSRFDQGDVIQLRDADGNGTADERSAVARIKGVHGLALKDRVVYLASTTKLFSAPLREDGKLNPPQEFAALPDGGQHPRRTLGFGPDDMLYVSNGSTCNNCDEKNPEHATIVRMKANGSQRAVFAKGLRNTIGFAWHPQTKELWGMDHGSDDRGNDVPGEELNLIREGGDYGWPWCYNNCEVDPIAKQPEHETKEKRCAKCTGPVLLYQAHAAPIAFIFYTGKQFPAEYENAGFVAFRGSWNRDPAVGYKVVRIRFKDGKPTGFEDFLTGFLIESGKAQFGRPAGLVIAKDGALLVSDDSNGVIYRIAYERGTSR